MMHHGGGFRCCIMGVCWKMMHHLHDCMTNTAHCMKETGHLGSSSHLDS